jgi:hypothetical protein
MQGVDYASGQAPPDYRYASCGAHGCKLWRLAYTMDPDLFCVACAEARTGDRLETGMGASDQIGGYVPAVPDEEGAGFWGYTSVPDTGVKWWHGLPMVLPQPKAGGR